MVKWRWPSVEVALLLVRLSKRGCEWNIPTIKNIFFTFVSKHLRQRVFQKRFHSVAPLIRDPFYPRLILHCCPSRRSFPAGLVIIAVAVKWHASIARLLGDIINVSYCSIYYMSYTFRKHFTFIPFFTGSAFSMKFLWWIFLFESRLILFIILPYTFQL